MDMLRRIRSSSTNTMKLPSSVTLGRLKGLKLVSGLPTSIPLGVLMSRSLLSPSVKRINWAPGLVGKSFDFKIDQTEEYLNKNIHVATKSNDEPFKLVSTTRIGVDYAGEDAKLPWRFYEDDHRLVSVKMKKAK